MKSPGFRSIFVDSGFGLFLENKSIFFLPPQSTKQLRRRPRFEKSTWLPTTRFTEENLIIGKRRWWWRFFFLLPFFIGSLDRGRKIDSGVFCFLQQKNIGRTFNWRSNRMKSSEFPCLARPYIYEGYYALDLFFLRCFGPPAHGEHSKK